MHIRCEHCGAGYELDLPRSALEQPTRKLKFRCSACGHSFIVRPPAPSEPSDDIVRPASGAPASPKFKQGMLLKQEGKVYHVSDVATLQRWIVERRVLADDLLATADGSWERVGSRADMAPFFQIVEQADLTSNSPGPMMEVDDIPTAEAAPPEKPAPARPAQPTIIPADDEARRALLEAAGLSGDGNETWPPDPQLAQANGPAQVSELAAPADCAPEADDPTVRMNPPELRDELVFDDPTDTMDPRPPTPDDPTDDAGQGGSVLHASPMLEVGLGEDDDLDDWRPRRRRWLPLVLVLMALCVVGAGLGGWAWSAYQNGGLAFLQPVAGAVPEKAPVEAVAEPAEATLAGADEEAAEPAEPVEDAAGTLAEEELTAEERPDGDAAEEVPPAEPTEDEPASEPVAEKPAPAPTSVASYVRRGWSAIDSGNLGAAQNYFEQALARQSSNADANFGLGYVYEKYGRKSTAVHYYCNARNLAGGNVDLKREVEGRLRDLSEACP